MQITAQTHDKEGAKQGTQTSRKKKDELKPVYMYYESVWYSMVPIPEKITQEEKPTHKPETGGGGGVGRKGCNTPWGTTFGDSYSSHPVIENPGVEPALSGLAQKEAPGKEDSLPKRRRTGSIGTLVQKYRTNQTTEKITRTNKVTEGSEKGLGSYPGSPVRIETSW